MKKHLLLAAVFASLLGSLFAGLEETIDFSGLNLPSITDSREMDRFHKSGCGFFITKDGYLITDKHLIADAKTILVVYGNKAYEADAVALKKSAGFAILRVRACRDIQPIVFSQERACRSGDKFLLAANSVSNEHGIIPTIQRGVVSDVLKETYRLYVPTAREHVGAPIGNSKGEVEGMLLGVGKHGQNFNSALCAAVIRSALPASVKRGLSFEASRVSDSNAAMQRLSRGVATVLVYNSEARAKEIREEGREGKETKPSSGKLQFRDLLKLTRRAKEKKTHYSGNGSGFFITNDGYFITNHHVIDGAEEILLVYDDKSYPAQIAAKNKEKDLALLKVEGVFKALPIAGSNSCEVGQNVFTVGFPKINLQGLSVKVTKGIVSSLTGFRDEAAQAQIDAPIQAGNSGGPVVDEDGVVVGVAVAKLRASENVNYMIKADELQAFFPKGVRSAINKSGDVSERGANVLKHVMERVALVVCYDKGAGSVIAEMASGDDRKRFAREVRRAIRAARMAKLDEDWTRVEAITDNVLSYDSFNDEAKSLNDLAKERLGKHLVIRAVVNENEVRAKIVPVTGFKRQHNFCEQPIELFDKDRKTGFPVVAKLLYEIDGVKYEGMLETHRNWSGMKEVTVRLEEVK